MANLSEKQRTLQDFAHEMKRDWDERARQNAKWFINTGKLQQSDKEFDASGKVEVERLVLADLPLLTHGRDPKSMQVLEIGCGLGRMTRYLAEVFGEVYATDVSPEMIKQAAGRLPGLTNVRLCETDGVDFAALPSNHFDIVFSAYVFQHVPSAEVIRANLADGYRVLKPGGVFRFQTSSITTFDFEDVEKDTWVGATFPETDIRRFAQEQGAQLIGIFGAGTQYCWTTLRKRERVTGSAPQYAVTRPQIEFYGRSDNPEVKEVCTSGEHTYLALVVSGLVCEEVDANSLTVEIDGQEILPRYVGPVSRAYEPAMKAKFGESLGHLTHVEVGVPIGEPSGQVKVRVRLSTDEASGPVTVSLREPQPVIPQIGLVKNGSDLGTEVYARGARSSLRLYVEGLDEAADTGNVRVQVGKRIIKPSYVGFLPDDGVYRVDVQLPKDIAPGVTDLRLYFGNLESPSKQLHIK